MKKQNVSQIPLFKAFLKNRLAALQTEITRIQQALKILSSLDTKPYEYSLAVATGLPRPRRRTVRHKIVCKQCGKKFIPKPTGKVPMFCHRPCTSWKYNWEQGTTKKQQAADKKALDEYKKASKKGELLMAGDPIRAAAAGH